MKIPADLRWKDTGKIIGQGGQGTVFTVKDGTGEFPGTYALKGLPNGKPPKAYERFARELDATKTLNHPGIVKVVDHSEPGANFHFYVMELIDGAHSLKKLMLSNENPFAGNPLRSINLFVQLVTAIGHCSEHKIVHRDLSPANVLILPNGDVKIIDFGLCQNDPDDTITLADEGVGTQNYMAPECESGAGGPVTWKSDLYSAGKILWSAMTNAQAFSREPPAFAAKSMNTLFPDLPAAWHLHHLFEKSIRHDPKDRFDDIAQALTTSRRMAFLVASGYPPIELLKEMCPLCGWGKLGSFEQSHSVFGNPNPAGIRSVQCNYCGFCFAQSHKILNAQIDKRASLR